MGYFQDHGNVKKQTVVMPHSLHTLKTTDLHTGHGGIQWELCPSKTIFEAKPQAYNSSHLKVRGRRIASSKAAWATKLVKAMDNLEKCCLGI